MQAIKILSVTTLVLITTLGSTIQAENVDISGFEEMTPDEYLQLVANRKITGITERGHDYVQSHTEDKRVNGIWGGSPYWGRWTAGDNNCTLLIIDWSPTETMCWKLLHKDGKYVYGYYNDSGTKLLTSHYVTFID